MDTDGTKANGHVSRESGEIPEGSDVRFYSTAGFNQRLDLIRHLIRNSERILLIRGERQTGKSTLLAYLQRLADEEWQICRIDATPMLQPDQLLHELAVCFRVSEGGGDPLGVLLSQMEDLYQTGRLPLILIDDAHLLPVSSLIVLFRLYENKGQGDLPLRIALFATPQMDDLLHTPQLQAMNTQALQLIDLLPLNLQQTTELARQIIQAEGGTGISVPSTSQLARLHRESRGLPGEVERLVRRLLKGKDKGGAPVEPDSREGLLADLPRSVLAGSAVLLLLILLTLIYQDQINALFQGEDDTDAVHQVPEVEDEPVIALRLPEQPQPEPAQTEPEETIVERVEALEEPGSEPPVPDMPASTPPELALPEIAPSPSPESVVLAPEVVIPDQPAASAMESEAKEAKADAQPELVQTEVPKSSESAPVLPERKPVERAQLHPPAEATAVEKPDTATPVEEKPAAAPPVEEPAPATSQILQAPVEITIPAGDKEQPPQVSAKPAPVQDLSEPADSANRKPSGEGAVGPKPKPEKPAPVSRRSLKDESWLLRQKPASFTLQLVGVQDEKAVLAFIRQNRLQGPVAYFRTTLNGRPWFSVVYGVYPSRTEAVAARGQLPGKLARSGVWPRTLGSVHEAIRTR